MTSIDILDNPLPAMRQLKAARKTRGLTQEKVAATMGVSQKRVSFIEGCDAEVMRLHTLDQYVKGLGGRLKVTVEFDDTEEA